MRVVYTYQGRDAAFEAAMLAVAGQVAPARQVDAREDPQQNITAVTLDMALDRPSDRLIGLLRSHERLIDVREEGMDRRVSPGAAP